MPSNFTRGRNPGTPTGTPPRRRKSDVMVHMNARGGPRIVGNDETVGLAEADTAMGEAKPEFRVMNKHKAKAAGFAYRPPGHHSGSPEEITEGMRRAGVPTTNDVSAIGIGYDAAYPAPDIATYPAGADLDEIFNKFPFNSMRQGSGGGLIDKLSKLPSRVYPTLADAMLQPEIIDGGINRHERVAMQQALRAADKLVLTIPATERIAEAIKSFPELLVDNGDFAIPPFPTTWIEYDPRPIARAMGVGQNIEEDYRVGYLIQGDKVSVASASHNMCAWIPINYLLHHPMSARMIREEAEYLHTTEENIDVMLWGATIYYNLSPPYQRGLHRSHTVRVVRDLPEPEALIDWARLTTDLRNIIGILLVLNQPGGVIEEKHIASRYRPIKGKTVKLQAHRVVNINLTARPRVRLLTPPRDDSRVRRHIRWHTVRGHFVHDKKARTSGCTHEGGSWWTQLDKTHWECLGCEGRRTWREYPNGRGDPSTPVDHHYVVKG